MTAKWRCIFADRDDRELDGEPPPIWEFADTIDLRLLRLDPTYKAPPPIRYALIGRDEEKRIAYYRLTSEEDA